MVKLYPVLVANSITRNILPGILKSIERFALIYKLEDIMAEARQGIKVVPSLRKVGGRTKLVIKETDEQIAEFLAKEFLSEQHPPEDPRSRYGSGTKRSQAGPWSYVSGPEEPSGTGPTQVHGSRQRQSQTQVQTQRQRMRQRQSVNINVQAPEAQPPRAPRTPEDIEAEERAKQRARAKDAAVGIGPMDMQSLMLEPTWMKVDLQSRDGQHKYSSVLGVKAVPTSVKSDAKLAELLMWDKQMGKLLMLITRWGRTVESFFYRTWKRTIGRFFGDTAISGDPYRDIVLKRTILSTRSADDIFLVVNQADLPEDFYARAGHMKKLFKLGWSSFCIADDVNRRVAFCMREFKGMCAILPYTMLYQSISQAKVFEDLEDVRRTSGALFKVKRPMKKVIGESMAQQKLDEFSVDLFPSINDQRDIELLQEAEMLNENLASLAKKAITAPKQLFVRAIKGTIKVPSIAPDKLAILGNRINPDFKKSYELSKKVLGNSLGTIKEGSLITWAALYVAIRATLDRSKPMLVATRDSLKGFIPLVRRGIRKATKGQMPPPQHIPEIFLGSVLYLSVITALVHLSTKFSVKAEAPKALEGIGAFLGKWLKIGYEKLMDLIEKIEDPALGKKVVADAKREVLHSEPYTQVKEFAESVGTYGLIMAYGIVILVGIHVIMSGFRGKK